MLVTLAHGYQTHHYKAIRVRRSVTAKNWEELKVKLPEKHFPNILSYSRTQPYINSLEYGWLFPPKIWWNNFWEKKCGPIPPWITHTVIILPTNMYSLSYKAISMATVRMADTRQILNKIIKSRMGRKIPEDESCQMYRDWVKNNLKTVFSKVLWTGENNSW